jgi:alpha-L-fucosidase
MTVIPEKLPRIERFEKLGYGMFIHWGLYSLLGKGEWVQSIHKIPAQQYQKLQEQFTAEDFDGRQIAKIAKQAGMKYAVLTTRHHEGFSLFDTCGLNTFDAPHSPAKRDLVADFVSGCRQEGIVPFFYHTTLDWYQQSFKDDFKAYLKYLRDSVEILCRNYGKIGGLWFDGNWSKPDADWQEDELYSLIRNYQPDAIIVNNTGLDARGRAGHPEIDSVTFEQGRPTPMNREGMPKYLAAEMCQTMNMHWGISTEDYGYLSPKDIIENLCACRKVGANYLLNVGPAASGKIPDYEKAAILRAGEWVQKYHRIICDAKPFAAYSGSSDFALELDSGLYLFIHSIASGGDHNVAVFRGKGKPIVFTGISKPANEIRWLDSDEKISFAQNSESAMLCLQTTPYPYGTNLVVRVAKVKF